MPRIFKCHWMDMDGVEYLRCLGGAFVGFWWCFWLDVSQMTSFFLIFVGDVSYLAMHLQDGSQNSSVQVAVGSPGGSVGTAALIPSLNRAVTTDGITYKSMVVSGSPKRWDRWHIIPPIGRKNTTYIPLIVLAFVWGVICYRSHL